MKLNGIDLFAGAGGLSEGFIQAGFNIIGTVEKDRWACETQKTRHIFHYLKKIGALDDYWEYCRKTTSPELIEQNRGKIYRNHPGLKEKIENTVWIAEFGNPNLRNGVLTSDQVIKKLKKSMTHNKTNAIDFISGGPPCQAYSVVGRNRMGNAVLQDERNYLFKFYYDIVKYFKPVFFLFENVPGIITARGGEIYDMIKEDFYRIDYHFISGEAENGDIRKNIKNALDFGVPQNRKRFIFLGIRSDVALKYPTFANNDTCKNCLITKNIISDLPALNANYGNDHWFGEYDNPENLSDYQKEIREESIGIMNHKARSINKEYDREIYQEAIRKAEKGRQLDYSKLPPRLKNHKNEKSFTDRFKVHWWEKIPHTVVAHISKDGHYNIHPDINQLRSITVREASRIQSFPDNYKFEGFRSSQFTQVGNAVPPKMAKAFAEEIRKQLEAL